MDGYQKTFTGIVLLLIAALFFLLNFSSHFPDIPRAGNFRLFFGLPLALFFATCITFVLRSDSHGESELSFGRHTFRGTGACLIVWFVIFAAIVAAVKIL